MDASDITALAAWVYELGGWDYWRGPSPSAISLVESTLGPGALITRRAHEWSWLPGQLAQLVWLAQPRLPHRYPGSERRGIVLRRGLSPHAAEHPALHELAEWALTDVARYQGADIEDRADDLADALLASHGGYRLVHADMWPDLQAIGALFGQSEQWAARRFSVVQSASVALVRGREVALKLGDFQWSHDATVLDLAYSPRPPAMFERETIGGRPRRIVLWVA